MKTDALIFMLVAWGCALGLLGYCIYKLVRNPQVVSVLTNSGSENKGQGSSGQAADE